MKTLQHFRRLGALDAKLIGRDGLLGGMMLIPLGVALAIRFLFPTILARLGTAIGIDALRFYPLIASGVLLLITPAVCGIVVGFLLLDQRDERTLQALAVTPLSLGRYLAYRLVVPTLLGVPMTIAAFALGGLAQFAPGAVGLAALAATPITPLLALALVSLAENKVQGMALQKAFSVLLILPLGGLLAPTPWNWLFGLLPTTWPLWVLWAWWPASLAALAGGLMYQSLLIVLLYWQFVRRSPV